VIVSRIELKWTDVIDPGRVERFLDIVVDGASLYERFWNKGLGNIALIGAFPSEDEEDKYVARLLGDLPPDSWAKQCCIYVCRGCGDINCGAITVKVEKRGDTVVWSGFAFEYPNYQDDKYEYEPIEPAMSYSIEARHLREVLLGRPRRLV
jgi:hypothetical protein